VGVGIVYVDPKADFKSFSPYLCRRIFGRDAF